MTNRQANMQAKVLNLLSFTFLTDVACLLKRFTECGLTIYGLTEADLKLFIASA